MLIYPRDLHNCLLRVCSWITTFLPQLCWLWIATSSGYCAPLYSAPLTCFPARGPPQFFLLFAYRRLLVLFWSPAMPLVHASCLGSKALVHLLVLKPLVGVHLARRCTVLSCIACLGARCLGSNWGLEVPGHPVLGSLHSPSTWRKVSFGWFPRPGLPWIPPLWLVAFAPR